MKSSKPKIIYIAGYGRSGSTILDVSLSQHRKIRGLGEVTNIFTEWNDSIKMSFWNHLLHDFEASKVNDYKRLTEAVQSTPLVFLSKSKYKAYRELWIEILSRASEGGKYILVDSSKTTRKTLFRPRRLECDDVEIKVILLKRKLKDVLKSAKKGSNRKLEQGNLSKSFSLLFQLRTMLSYLYTNSVTYLVYRTAIVHRINYEDFIENPTLELNNLMNRCGLSDIQFSTELEAREFQPGNGISGNRLRRSKIKGIKR